MHDDELIRRLRTIASNANTAAADRIESLLAEVAGLRAERGRVPVSWDECADWLDAGFDVAGSTGNARFLTRYSAAYFRRYSAAYFRANVPALNGMVLSDYRLLPPPGLVAAPSGMDGGGFLGAGADVPNGWQWRPHVDHDWMAMQPYGGTIVQCRPPVKPAERAVVEVPLTQLVGRVIEGETEPVGSPPVWTFIGTGSEWRWLPSECVKWHRFPDGTLDMETGRVRVYAEGDA